VKSLLQLAVDNPTDRWWATAATGALLLLFLLLVTIMLRSTHKVHSFAFNKQQQITVSIVSIPAPRRTQSEMPKVQQKTQSDSKAAVEPEPVEDIASLFSSVNTHKIQHSKKTDKIREDEKRRMALLQRRIKKIEKSDTTNSKSVIEPLQLISPVNVKGANAASGGEIVDKYYARIQALIYQHFFPPLNSEGAVAIVRIELTAEGRLSGYTILKRSGEHFFDREAEALQSRLENVDFSPSPSGKRSVLDVRLISKE